MRSEEHAKKHFLKAVKRSYSISFGPSHHNADIDQSCSREKSITSVLYIGGSGTEPSKCDSRSAGFKMKWYE